MLFEDVFYELNTLRKCLVIAVASLFLLLVFYVVVIMHMNPAPIEAQIALLKSEVQIQEEQQKKIQALKGKIDHYRRERETMLQSLPEKQDMDALTKQIDHLISESGLETLKFFPGKEKLNVHSFTEMDFQLEVRGDYRKVGYLLGKIDDIPRVINIARISLRPREGGVSKHSQAMVLDTSIAGLTYRRLSTDEIKSLEGSKKEAQGKDGR